tara:strand:+ start:3438 stop:3818 length:381 start_codon:yes stop_codon:yes gene_type:complete
MLKLVKDKEIKIALIGASSDKSKFGYKIYRNLLSKGYDVIPINPKNIRIDGITSLSCVSEMKESPDIIDFVIPPVQAFSEAKKLSNEGYNNFWFQPGSESEELTKYLDNLNINYLTNECIMTETNP